MASASATITIAAPARRVWEIFGDFGGLHVWHPAILKTFKLEGEGVGAVRHLEVDGMGVAIETLVEHDDEAMRLVYAASQLPLPVRGYSGVMTVRPAGPDSAEVQWTGSFEPDGAPEADLTAGLTGFYQAGLAALAAQLA